MARPGVFAFPSAPVLQEKKPNTCKTVTWWKVCVHVCVCVCAYHEYWPIHIHTRCFCKALWIDGTAQERERERETWVFLIWIRPKTTRTWNVVNLYWEHVWKAEIQRKLLHFLSIRCQRKDGHRPLLQATEARGSVFHANFTHGSKVWAKTTGIVARKLCQLPQWPWNMAEAIQKTEEGGCWFRSWYVLLKMVLWGPIHWRDATSTYLNIFLHQLSTGSYDILRDPGNDEWRNDWNDSDFGTLPLISMLLKARAELEAARAAYLQHLAQVQPGWNTLETIDKQMTNKWQSTSSTGHPAASNIRFRR